MPEAEITKAIVEPYAYGIARTSCTECGQDIYFFYDEGEETPTIRRVQHGDDPDKAIDLKIKNPRRRLNQFLKWHKALHV